MQKNLPYFIVIAALIFLIIGVLSSGKKQMETALPPDLINAQTVLQGIEPGAAEQQNSQQNTPKKAAAKVIFGFEEKMLLWEIPDWCFEKEDYVAKHIASSSKVANEGKGSLELLTDFPGGKWSAAYIETQEYFDWTPYQKLSVDVYLPADAPFGLTAKMILTVGEDWAWTEMNRSIKLIPGEWTTVTASLIPESADWRRTQVTDAFRADVRKLGVRIESNMRPVYAGVVYIDNVRVD